jgi:hypothetical protein
MDRALVRADDRDFVAAVRLLDREEVWEEPLRAHDGATMSRRAISNEVARFIGLRYYQTFRSCRIGRRMNRTSKRVLMSLFFMAVALATVFIPSPAETRRTAAQRAAFVGVWVDIRSSCRTIVRQFKFEEHGTQLAIYVAPSAGDGWMQMFRRTSIEGNTVRGSLPQGCGPIHQTPGYNYDRAAGNIVWSFRLEAPTKGSPFGPLLILSDETEWYVPCGGHPIGREREVTVLRRLDDPVTKPDRNCRERRNSDTLRP